jgi:hypothetical protein
MACFLRSMCPALSAASPFQPPAHTCSTPCTTDNATTLDSLVGPPASVTSILLGSPIMSPQPPPRSRFFCCSHQVSCVSGTSDQISDDELRSPRLHGTFPISFLPMLLLPRLPTVMTKFSFRVSHTVLWVCDGDAEVSLPRPGVSCLSSSPSYCSPSICPAGWRPWPIPSWVWLIPICFFFFTFSKFTYFYKGHTQTPRRSLQGKSNVPYLVGLKATFAQICVVNEGVDRRASQ